jgi:polar amino acid transport system permease protein
MHPDSVSARPARGDLWVVALVLGAAGYTLYRLTYQLNYHWDWTAIPRYILRFDLKSGEYVPNLLLIGLLTTLRLTIWGGIIALLMGTAVGCARAASPLFFRLSGRAYVECVRNIPELVFIFIFYFFIASQLMPYLGLDEAVAHASPGALAVIGVLFGDPALFTSFVPAVLAIGLFEAAAVGEIVRAGIQSVPRGQTEAARALGLRSWPVARRIVFPQAMKRILPPLAGQLIALVKDSSLAAIISVPELSFEGSQVAGATRRMFESWLSVGFFYFVICFSLSMLFAKLERRSRMKDQRRG